jgi:hypothetical protein
MTQDLLDKQMLCDWIASDNNGGNARPIDSDFLCEIAKYISMMIIAVTDLQHGLGKPRAELPISWREIVGAVQR